MLIKLTRLFTVFAIVALSDAFLSPSPFSKQSTAGRTLRQDADTSWMILRPSHHQSSTGTSLFGESGGSSNYDGTSGRGLILFSIVFGLCVWIFSIPPEFRRAYLCSPECQENPIYCTTECVTPAEWVAGVKSYYQNGGGIQFDFSIDPKTKQLWGGQ